MNTKPAPLYRSAESASKAIGRFVTSYNFLLRKLHNQAKRDACKGDICIGWDWPTLAIVKPAEYARLQELKAQARIARGYVQFYSPAVLEYAV